MSEKLQEETQLDEEILWKIKYDIYKLEEDNLKTKQKTDSGMVDAIRKIIIDALSDKNFQGGTIYAYKIIKVQEFQTI